jgi:uncharacterized protein YneF (UPF0154 family)
MSTWVIISWVLVALLTAVNVFVFLKLKGASEQMMKMAFPNAKNLNEAMSQAQAMMGNMGGGGRSPFTGMPTGGGRGAAPGSDAQLKAAMEMLKKKKR